MHDLEKVCRKTLSSPPVEGVFGEPVLEALDHGTDVSWRDTSVKLMYHEMIQSRDCASGDALTGSPTSREDL